MYLCDISANIKILRAQAYPKAQAGSAPLNPHKAGVPTNRTIRSTEQREDSLSLAMRSILIHR